MVHTGSYWALLGPIQSYWALLGPIQPYWALLSLTVSFIAFADERTYVHYDLLGCFRSQKFLRSNNIQCFCLYAIRTEDTYIFELTGMT